MTDSIDYGAIADALTNDTELNNLLNMNTTLTFQKKNKFLEVIKISCKIFPLIPLDHTF